MQDDSGDEEENRNKEEINLDELSEPSINTDNARAARELKNAMVEEKAPIDKTAPESTIVSTDNSSGIVTVMDPLPLEPSSSSEESSESELDEMEEEEQAPLPFEEAIKVEGLGVAKYYKGFCIDTCQHKLDFQNLNFKPWEVP